MEWSTYWRKTRALKVKMTVEKELILEAPAIQEWAEKNRPRPW